MFVISLQSLQRNQLFAIKTIKKNKYFRQIKLRVGTGNVSKRHQPKYYVTFGGSGGEDDVYM